MEKSKSKSQKDRLLWVINFINQDIDSLKTGDFLKILSELKGNFKKPNPGIINISELPIRFLSFPDRVGNTENALAYIHQETRPSFDNPENRALVKYIQKQAKYFIESLEKTKRINTITSIKFEINFTVLGGDNFLSTFKGTDKKYIEQEIFQLLYDCAEWKDEWGFVRSLESLKKCRAPGCNHFFLAGP